MKAVRHRIVRAATLMLALQVVEQAVALMKQALIASYFGTSALMDAFLAATALVGLIHLWVRLPIRQTIIPMFRYDMRRHGEETAWANFSVLLNNLVVVVVSVAVVGALIAPYAVSLVVPGFDDKTAGLAVSLAQIKMVNVVFIGLGGVLSQAFFSYERFFVPSVKETAGDVATMLVLVAVVGTYGIYGLAVGAILGGIVEFMLHLPLLWEKRRYYLLRVDPRHPSMRE